MKKIYYQNQFIRRYAHSMSCTYYNCTSIRKIAIDESGVNYDSEVNTLADEEPDYMNYI